MLFPESRPVVWKHTSGEFDQELVGLAHESLTEIPADSSASERREVFNTKAFGKSAAGHTFVNRLDGSEKEAVLEYLKTL